MIHFKFNTIYNLIILKEQLISFPFNKYRDIFLKQILLFIDINHFHQYTNNLSQQLKHKLSNHIEKQVIVSIYFF